MSKLPTCAVFVAPSVWLKSNTLPTQHRTQSSNSVASLPRKVRRYRSQETGYFWFISSTFYDRSWQKLPFAIFYQYALLIDPVSVSAAIVHSCMRLLTCARIPRVLQPQFESLFFRLQRDPLLKLGEWEIFVRLHSHPVVKWSLKK